MSLSLNFITARKKNVSGVLFLMLKFNFTIYNSRDLSGTLPEQPSHFKPLCNQPFLLKSKRFFKRKTAEMLHF